MKVKVIDNLLWSLKALFVPLPDKQAWLFHNNGRYRVLYPDGDYSLWMDKKTASEYASIFGGTVERQAL